LDDFPELPYRLFVTDFHTGQTFDTRIEPTGEQRRMVLDGQQRLQSLYLAIFGSLNGRRLYFNVTSGPMSSRSDEEDDGDTIGRRHARTLLPPERWESQRILNPRAVANPLRTLTPAASLPTAYRG
jgi:hypothetical protein